MSSVHKNPNQHQSRAITLLQNCEKSCIPIPTFILEMNTQELAEFRPFVNCYQDIKQNQILTSIKGHKSVRNLQKMTGNKPNLDYVNITAYSKYTDIFCPFLLKILNRNKILKYQSRAITLLQICKNDRYDPNLDHACQY